jgi:hypothetical protein
MTDTLRNKLRPFVEKIVNDLVEEAVTMIETTARERLRAALEPLPVARVPKLKTKKQRAKVAKAVRAMERDAKPANTVQRDPKPEKKKRAKMRCGNCGEVGFRREGCGKTHNVGLAVPIKSDIQREWEAGRVTARANAVERAKPTPQQLSVLERARARAQ